MVAYPPYKKYVIFTNLFLCFLILPLFSLQADEQILGCDLNRWYSLKKELPAVQFRFSQDKLPYPHLLLRTTLDAPSCKIEKGLTDFSNLQSIAESRFVKSTILHQTEFPIRFTLDMGKSLYEDVEIQEGIISIVRFEIDTEWYFPNIELTLLFISDMDRTTGDRYLYWVLYDMDYYARLAPYIRKPKLKWRWNQPPRTPNDQDKYPNSHNDLYGFCRLEDINNSKTNVHIENYFHPAWYAAPFLEDVLDIMLEEFLVIINYLSE